MKKYEAPELFVDTFAADTMIASSRTKNGNPDNNQNCWGYDQNPGDSDRTGTNSCVYDPKNNPAAYDYYCK